MPPKPSSQSSTAWAAFPDRISDAGLTKQVPAATSKITPSQPSLNHPKGIRKVDPRWDLNSEFKLSDGRAGTDHDHHSPGQVEIELAGDTMGSVINALHNEIQARPETRTGSHGAATYKKRHLTDSPPVSPAPLTPSPNLSSNTWAVNRSHLQQEAYRQLISHDKEAHLLMKSIEGIREWWLKNKQEWQKAKEQLEALEAKEMEDVGDKDVKELLVSWFINNKMVMREVWIQFEELKKKSNHMALSFESVSDSEDEPKRAERRTRGRVHERIAELELFSHVNVEDVRDAPWFAQKGPEGLVKWHDLSRIELKGFTNRITRWLERDKADARNTEYRRAGERAGNYRTAMDLKIWGLGLHIQNLEADLLRASVLKKLLHYIYEKILLRYNPSDVPEKDWTDIISPIQLLFYNHNIRRELQNRLWKVTSKPPLLQNQAEIYRIYEDYTKKHIIGAFVDQYTSLHEREEIHTCIQLMKDFLDNENTMFEAIVLGIEELVAEENPPQPAPQSSRKKSFSHSRGRPSPTKSFSLTQSSKRSQSLKNEKSAGTESSGWESKRSLSSNAKIASAASLLESIPSIEVEGEKPKEPQTWQQLLYAFFTSPDIFLLFRDPSLRGQKYKKQVWSREDLGEDVNALLFKDVPANVLDAFLRYCTYVRELFWVDGERINLTDSGWIGAEEHNVGGPLRKIPLSTIERPEGVDIAEQYIRDEKFNGYLLTMGRRIPKWDLFMYLCGSKRFNKLTEVQFDNFLWYWTQVGKFFVIQNDSEWYDSEGNKAPTETHHVYRLDNGFDWNKEGVPYRPLKHKTPNFNKIKDFVEQRDINKILTKPGDTAKLRYTDENTLYTFLFLGPGRPAGYLNWEFTRVAFHYFLRQCSETGILFVLDRSGKVSLLQKTWVVKQSPAFDPSSPRQKRRK